MAAFVPWGRLVLIGGDGAGRIEWELRGDGPPDLAAVDALARAQLGALRAGGTLRLDGADPRLRELLALVGLLGKMCGEPEDGEEVGVEEVVVPDDPAV